MCLADLLDDVTLVYLVRCPREAIPAYLLQGRIAVGQEERRIRVHRVVVLLRRDEGGVSFPFVFSARAMRLGYSGISKATPAERPGRAAAP